MKTTKYLSLLLCLLCVSEAGTSRADTISPSLTSIALTNNEVSLMWTNGRPTYQVQTRTSFSNSWVNVGSATSNYSAAITPSGVEAYYRVVSDFTARYQVVFNAT